MSRPGSSSTTDRANSPTASSLSSTLTAHLSKPVASSPSRSSGGVEGESAPRPAGMPGVSANSSKAKATAAGPESVATMGGSELWKSSAAKRAEKTWAIQAEKSQYKP